MLDGSAHSDPIAVTVDRDRCASYRPLSAEVRVKIHIMVWFRRSALAAVALLTLAVGLVLPGDAIAAGSTLPLGDSSLPETRSAQALAPGVTLTRIVRGTLPAAEKEIGTTRRGPWRVSVLTIDPRLARGHLASTYGPTLGKVETTSALTGSVGALAGVNASYFTSTKNRAFPGDPVGLGLYRGAVQSEPNAAPHEVDLLIDSRTNKIRIDHLTWKGRVKNRKTGKTLKLEYLNHPPKVPKTCAKLKDPTRCTKSGDVVRFRPEFGRTPTGPGVEVVLDRSGCVLRSTTKRGAVLLAGQSSLQATGKQTKTLLKLTERGCLRTSITLYGPHKKKVTVTPTTYGVTGRYQLTRGGRVTAPQRTGDYYERHPRTVVGRTASGVVTLVTIDGGRPTSVGATLPEAAAVARALGLVDSVNLDGGGSTTMAVGGTVVNQPKGRSERAVGDALVYVDRPWT
jgi:hypothetical protein